MNKANFESRLAVCSWSLQVGSPAQLVGALQELEIKRLQIALDPIRQEPDLWKPLAEECSRAGILMVSGMITTVGEDYTTMESIKRTGGLVPDATWPENLKNIEENAKIAERLGLKLVTFHAGFIPEAPSDSAYSELLDRVRIVADIFAKRHVELAFETGQEDAEPLATFLEALDRKDVGVNFDPANMILYGRGNPIKALRELAPWLKQCHVKDATRTKVPGTWGQEVVVGTGEVSWKQFLSTLDQIKFKGSLCIEREAGTDRQRDIALAREHLLSLI